MNNNEAVKEKEDRKTAIFEKLMKSIVSDKVDNEEMEDLSRNEDSADDAVKLVGRIERIIKSKKSKIFILAYHQGLAFKKFKENINSTSPISNLKISKATINFKIGIIQFLHDYPKMRKSSISLPFLKNDFRLFKKVCKEHASEFKCYFFEILITMVWCLYYNKGVILVIVASIAVSYSNCLKFQS